MPLLEIYESLSAEVLDEYLRTGQEENLHLEFKTLGGPELKARDDRRNFACAVSGFANAAGGIIIWGVDARKNDAGIDCAVALRPIERVAALVGRLNEFTGQAAEPIVGGVLNRVVSESDAGAGIAATLVPESDAAPHMAKLGESRYYKRSGDSFYQMEHFDIADMFGRRRKPRLEITVRVPPGNIQQIIVGLKNSGRASARAPYLSVSMPPPYSRSRYGVSGNGHEGLTFLAAQSPGSRQWAFGGNADIVIHPGVSLDVALFSGENNVTPIPPEGITLSYAIACEDQPQRAHHYVLSVTELAGK